MKKILFLVTANKTNFFIEIEKKLSKSYDFFWVTPSETWFQKLLDFGIKENRILHLGKRISININSNEYVNSIKEIEKFSSLTINQIVSMDRVLKEKNIKKSKEIVISNYLAISDFIIQNSIDVIFSEQTWNFEIMATIAAKKNKIKSFHVDGVKVPDGEEFGRFAFFEGFFMDKIYGTVKPKSEDYLFAENFLSFYRNKEPNTAYYKPFNKKVAIKKDWPLKFLRHLYLLIYDRHDFTRRSLISIVVYNLFRLKNYVLYRFHNPFDSIEKLDNKKFIFIALHKQPDSSVYVCASDYIDQLAAIEALIKKIPFGIFIAIKDSPHAIGNNNLSFYKRLKKFENVYVIKPLESTFKLIRNSECVISIGGTVSLESAIAGKRSATAVKKFFSDLCIDEIDFYTTTSKKITQILSNKPPSDKKIIDYLAMIHANSYKGMFYDPTTSKSFSSDANIANIVKGFESFLNESNQESK